MSYPYYPDPIRRPDGTVQLPAFNRTRQADPAGYLPDQGLIDAVNVALLLGQPLLVTGEPGTGKTELARHLAFTLGLGEPLKFETKSNSTARDLFYTYDAVGHFRDGQAGGTNSALSYLRWNALGEAILLSREKEDVKDWLTPGFEHTGPRRSVLRRCIYYDIAFPTGNRLAEIVLSRVGSFADEKSKLLVEALDLFEYLRQRGLRKSPATAELIGWLTALSDMGARLEQPLRDQSDLLDKSLSALIKSKEDQEAAQISVKEWLKKEKV